MRTWLIPTLIVVVAGALWWTIREEPVDVVLYCAVDQDQSRPIAEGYAKKAGVALRYVGEIETMRSVGLSRKLSEEKSAPQADVFWNNELMTTVYLGSNGILDALPAGVAEGFPQEWRDPEGRWVAFGARARVLLVNTELLPDPADHPDSIEDLLDKRYGEKGLRTCMARPQTGTTYTHAVVLLTQQKERWMTFLGEVAREGAKKDGSRLLLVGGNADSMRQAAQSSNKVAFALTDTDDARFAIREGAPVKVVYPDQGEGGLGTLVIPNSVALVKGRPHPTGAPGELLKHLVSAETERTLAFSDSAQIPLRPGVEAPEHVKRPGKDFRAMTVDWAAAARNRDSFRDWLTSVFRPAN